MENQGKNLEQDFTMTQNVEQVQISDVTRKLMKCHAMLIDVSRFLASEMEGKQAKIHNLQHEIDSAQEAVWKAESEIAALIGVYSVNIKVETDYKFI